MSFTYQRRTIFAGLLQKFFNLLHLKTFSIYNLVYNAFLVIFLSYFLFCTYVMNKIESKRDMRKIRLIQTNHKLVPIRKDTTYYELESQLINQYLIESLVLCFVMLLIYRYFNSIFIMLLEIIWLLHKLFRTKLFGIYLFNRVYNSPYNEIVL